MCMRQTYAPRVRDHARQLGVAAERGDVVDELRAELERAPRDRRLRGVDRDREPREGLEHRLDARELLLRAHRFRAGARRLAADVHERRALLGSRRPCDDGVGGRREAAAVGETVGRDVQHAHHRRPRPALLDRDRGLAHAG